MSLPKQPRQLMITLMYLVLLAMLALNVSAEIMNAFLTLDKGIGNSNGIVDSTNGQIMKSISSQADAYKKFKPFELSAEETRSVSKEMDDYLKVLREELFALAGGPDPENPSRPVRYKDKDIAPKLLIKEGRGEALREKIIETREKLLSLIKDEKAREDIAQNLPLEIPEIPENSDKPTWSESAFDQMPVVAVMPMFNKLINDVKTSETAILNHFFKKAKGEDYVPDAFEVVVATDKGYVINGESINGEVFLGSYSSSNNNGMRVTIDGESYPVRNGKAVFDIKANSLGKKEHKAVVTMRNPLTGEVSTFDKIFKYEVGERNVTVAAEKMNVLYVGVENPIAVSAAGTNTNLLKVRAEGTPLNKINNTKYMAKPTRTGMAKITVSGGGLPSTSFEYRVKKIPDPVIKLGNKRGGKISKSEFKTHRGPVPFLENFDFEADCKIMGFELVRVPKRGDARRQLNQGGRYNSSTQTLVNQADHDDTYYFNNLKVKCPGDTAGRELNGLIFNIR